MKLQQLSVFLENKPGALTHPCRILAEAGLNLLTLSLADTHQFGLLRLVVEDAETACRLLEENGCAVQITEVLAIEVPDRPGGLLAVLDVLEQAGLNVEYMYAFTRRRGDRAILVLRFQDADAALTVLQTARVKVLAPGELFEPPDP